MLNYLSVKRKVEVAEDELVECHRDGRPEVQEGPRTEDVMHLKQIKTMLAQIEKTNEFKNVCMSW